MVPMNLKLFFILKSFNSQAKVIKILFSTNMVFKAKVKIRYTREITWFDYTLINCKFLTLNSKISRL